MAVFVAILFFVFAAGGLTRYAVFRYLGANSDVGDGHARLADETSRDLPQNARNEVNQGKDRRGKEKTVQPDGSVPRSKEEEPKSPAVKAEPQKPTPQEESFPKLPSPVQKEPKTPPAKVEPPQSPTKEELSPPRKEETKPNDPPATITKEESPTRKEEPEPKPTPVVKSPKPLTLDPSLGGATQESVVVKRRKETSDEDLRKQLLSVPEVGMDQAAASMLYAPLIEFEKRRKSPSSLEPDYGPRFLAERAKSQKRPELTYFPWQKGADCQLGKESADRLHVLSINLRTCLRASTPRGDIRPDPDRLRALLFNGSLPGQARLRGVSNAEIKPSEWLQAGAIPALVQLLQHENTPIRLLLVEMLSQIEGKEAGAALAQRALFDLSQQVREKAVQALVDRPMTEYQQALVDGFRHPWPAVADNAAEALVAVKDRDALPALIDLLTEPDPKLPVVVKEKDKDVLATRELVRINHMSNCMLCHAPSLSKEDLVRGHVPVPGEDPPPLYYAEKTGMFVRADTTFLRQDFSVVQPVASSGKWPGNQRFDYLVRTRPLSKAERTRYEQWQKENPKPDTYEQREALLFTLKELTGKNPGSSYEDWKPLLKSMTPKKGTNEQQSRKDAKELPASRPKTPDESRQKPADRQIAQGVEPLDTISGVLTISIPKLPIERDTRGSQRPAADRVIRLPLTPAQKNEQNGVLPAIVPAQGPRDIAPIAEPQDKAGPAIADLTKAIAQNPNDAQGYYRRANAYYAKGEYGLAVRDFNQAVQLNPELLDAFEKRDLAYKKMLKASPVPGYKQSTIEGFTVLISADVEANNETSGYQRKPIEVLQSELKTISTLLQGRSLRRLQTVPIWVEWADPDRTGNLAQYTCASGRCTLKDMGEPRNPLKANCVEVTHMQKLTAMHQPDQMAEPCILLHEFAHAVHLQVFGSENLVINSAYRQAMDRKLYDTSRAVDGRVITPYARTNSREYFAELSCAYFGKLSYFPFTRSELQKYDPVGARVMEITWGKATPAPVQSVNPITKSPTSPPTKVDSVAAPKPVGIPSGKDFVYLSDMDEFGVDVAEGRFAKKGDLGYNAGDPPSSKIIVKGKESANGLSMCPASSSSAVAKYEIARETQTFLADVALNDSAGGPGRPPGVGKIPTPLTFEVVGDGKILWKSKPVDTARYVQECKVDVSGVAILELRVQYPGSNVNAQAVWVDPRVLR